MPHETTIIDTSGHTPASASCICGWAYSGGGYYRCLQAAQTHRLDALERREAVTYAWQREPAFTNPAPPKAVFIV